MMKKKIFLLVVFTLCIVKVDAISCYRVKKFKEQNLQKIYDILKNKSNKCNFNGLVYIKFSRRALSVGRLQQALWAARRSKKIYQSSSKFKHRFLEAIKLETLTLIEKNQFHTAETILKKNILIGSFKKESLTRTLARQRLFLLLLHLYKNTKLKSKKNFQYIRKVFRYRYPKSSYLGLINMKQ